MRTPGALLAAALPLVHAVATSPISKVLQLLSDMETKIIGEGHEAHTAYATAAEWCEERSKNLQYEIKTVQALQPTKVTSRPQPPSAKKKRLTSQLKKRNCL